jgi:hypothetical protein
MKKIIILFSATLLFISCSTDDDGSTVDPNAQAQNLIGTWLLAEITQDGTVSTDVQGLPVSGTITSFGKDIDAQIIFSENPDNYVTSGGYTDVITVNVLEQIFNEEQNISIADILGQGSWSLDQGILTLTQSSDVRAASVIELTTTSLKLEIEINEQAVLQGITGNIESTLMMTLTKQ